MSDNDFPFYDPIDPETIKEFEELVRKNITLKKERNDQSRLEPNKRKSSDGEL